MNGLAPARFELIEGDDMLYAIDWLTGEFMPVLLIEWDEIARQIVALNERWAAYCYQLQQQEQSFGRPVRGIR